MTGRHRTSPPMHSDDPVAPGIRRHRAAWITAIGLVLVLAAIVNIVLVLDDKASTAQKDASLSSDEVRELREFLTDRTQQRDAERRATQAQLDDQRRALCTAIQTLSAAAKPRGRAVLDKASRDLSCARVGAVPNTSTSRATSGRPPAASTSVQPSRTLGATPLPVTTSPITRPRATASPRRAPAPAVPPPQAPEPAPAPTTPKAPLPAAPPAASGLLEPVTDPICTVTGVCL